MKADLHVHTKESDGCLSVEEVMKTASEQGVEILAITDHETTSGVDKANKIALNYGIKVIPGVEIFTAYHEEEIHLLAYYKNINHDRLQQKLKQIREDRTKITQGMVKKLNRQGIAIEWEEVKQEASPDGVICKTHIMYAINNKIKETDQLNWHTIASWFRPGGIAYIPYYGHSYKDAVDLIFDTGGLPVLAHPGLIRNKSLIQDLLTYKPIGLEVYYAYWENIAQTISFFKEISDQNAILATGGSDYHGFYSPVGIGKTNIPDKCVIDLERFLHIE